MDALVSTGWLAARLAEPSVRIVDTRWYLDPLRRGIDGYRSGHIPGAFFFDLDQDLAAPGGRRGGPLGRHPWPSADQIARVCGGAGIDAETHVVAYDDQAGAIAARLWFVLRAYGHERVSVLDGGLVKWTAEGRPLDTAEPVQREAVFVPRFRPELVWSKLDVAGRDAATLLLDARLPARYNGETEPIDLRAGHVPGAVNAPYTSNLTAGSAPVFRSPEELRRHFAALGAGEREVVVYCGSGVTACHDLLALHVAGFGGRLYAGSWSEWSSDPALPIETTAPLR